jgi:predicted DNA-binding transcriptional regulator YafY
MSDPTSRLLRLLGLLQTHRFWSGDELARRLGVTTRTIRRDVERLRALGYPVAAQLGADGGYQLEAGSLLPPLLLDDEEAVAIAVGLRTAVHGAVAGVEEVSLRALAKLEQVLPARLRRRVAALAEFTVPMAGPPAAAVDGETLAVLSLACRDRERVRFRYTARDGARTRRAVEPHRLVSAGRRWYLLAWDTDRADWRTFRVDRLAEVQHTGLRFPPRPLPADDVAAYVRAALRAGVPQHDFAVRFLAPFDEARERVPAWAGTLEPDGPASARLTGCTESLEWTAGLLGAVGLDLEVIAPDALRDCAREIGARLRAAADPVSTQQSPT